MGKGRRRARQGRNKAGERPVKHDATSARGDGRHRFPPGDASHTLGWSRPLLTVAAALYLFVLFLGGARAAGASHLFPKTLQYFTQVACLFPHALPVSIDYRLERWDCQAERFEEMDTAPYFPIRPHDKENRFKRLGFFHRRSRSVMEALEHYILTSVENPVSPEGRRFGGIRLISLRLPFPSLGEPVAPYQPAQLRELTPRQMKAWFFTPVSRRRLWCSGATAPLARWKAARATKTRNTAND